MVAALSFLFLRAVAADPGLPIFVPQQGASQAVFVGNREIIGPDPRVRWDDDGMVFLDVPVEGGKQDFGYLASRYALRNYRLSLEYQWRTKRFPPRQGSLRDSGLLYHLTARDAVGPDGVECHIQEGETGDAFLFGDGMKAEGPVPDGGSFQRTKTADHPTGWNRVELTVKGSEATHRVNGQTVNRLTNLRRGNGSPVTEGRVALRLEGAEIRYRDARVTPLRWPHRHPPFRILLFSKTAGFRHDSIPAGIAAIRGLGKAFGFEVEATEDAGAFTPERLKSYRAVVFLSTTGDVLDETQQRAFEGYIKGGGGFVGIHAASDTEYDWPWYGRLVGAWFASHPAPQQATVRLRKNDAVSTASLPHAWSRMDEWYNFRRPTQDVEVLADLDESSYQGGTMGDHPIAWQHRFEGGRAWYTAMGHTKESYVDPPFLLHLLGGIAYASRL